jgi:drug/metabolite transporter (DMT)-like permease
VAERALSAFTLTLVLSAAVMHASWNALAKRAAGGIAFIWLYFALSFAIYLPVIAVVSVLLRPHLTTIDWLFIAGNGALHLVYFVLLQRGYRAGDLSLVYPLARGTGPLLSSLVAVVLLGERPGLFGYAGIALIVCGIFLGSGIGAERPATAEPRRVRLSVVYGLATGVSIAVYTLWDKYSVSVLAISPIIYDFWGNAARTALTTPFVIHRRGEIAAAWRAHRWEALGIAVLSPLAYLLILWALVSAPVSLVAPAREISIVIGAALGVRLFGEPAGGRRIIAAALMVAGLASLALK